MMTTLANFDDPKDASDLVSLATVCRRAFYLTSQGQPLFAWLHFPKAMPSVSHGVLICPPLGYEQVHSHRALRHLADALAQAGVVVCRLDYAGTGDSAGIDEDPDRLVTWRANIRDALAWLETQAGCCRLSLIGLRLGAALALEIAAERAVENLVLWVPVLKGRQYIREVQILGMAGEIELLQDEADIEAGGFVVTRQTATDLASFDALKISPKCRRAFIVVRDDLSDDRRLVDHLTQSGIKAQQVRLPGYQNLMAEPHNSKVPWQTIGTIVDWFVAEKTELASTPNEAGLPLVSATEVLMSCSAVSPVPKIRERLLPISDRSSLFGIISEPESDRKDPGPLIVLLNAGSAYRVGPNRLNVLLARELAAQGMRCLRVDLGGLGDSVTAKADDDNCTYAITIFRDIDLVLKYAQSQLGADRVVLMGLCSGAYFAFQAAAQFANPILVECVLINPLTFYWKDGLSLQTPSAKDFATFHYYAQAAWQPSKWWKLITGQSRIGVVGAIKMLTNRLRHRQKSDEGAEGAVHAHSADADIGHPHRDDLTGDLQRIEMAGRRIACFFSSADPGYSILMYHARRKVKALCRAGVVDIHFIPNADHTFSRRRQRSEAVQTITQYLRERFRPTPDRD